MARTISLPPPRYASPALVASYGWVWHGLAGVFLLGVLGWGLWKVSAPTLPSPFPSQWYGVHIFSDFLTIMAGERFAQEGFWNHYFLANMTVGYPEFSRGWYFYQVPQIHPNSAIYYTHYGSLDTIFNGVLQSLGMTGLRGFYQVAVVLSVLGLAAWYVTTALVFGRAVALFSTLFLGSSVIFLRHIETISAEGLALPLAFGAALALVLGEGASSRRKRWLGYGGAWLLTLLQANNNPQLLLWHLAFFVGYLWVCRG